MCNDRRAMPRERRLRLTHYYRKRKHETAALSAIIKCGSRVVVTAIVLAAHSHTQSSGLALGLGQLPPGGRRILCFNAKQIQLIQHAGLGPTVHSESHHTRYKTTGLDVVSCCGTLRCADYSTYCLVIKDGHGDPSPAASRQLALMTAGWNPISPCVTLGH